MRTSWLNVGGVRCRIADNKSRWCLLRIETGSQCRARLSTVDTVLAIHGLLCSKGVIYSTAYRAVVHGVIREAVRAAARCCSSKS